jgi:hypothetical protein
MPWFSLTITPILPEFPMRTSSLAIILVLAFSQHLLAGKPVGIQVFPSNIDLTYQNSRQRITIQTILSDGSIGPAIASKPQVQLLDPSLVQWEASETGVLQLTAKRSGTTTLQIEHQLSDGQTLTASATIVCRDAEKPREIEFTNHIESVLARSSCNMGACHGALAGKGGFKLSLRGYDPVTDHFNITRQDGGRRVELSSPALSLFIAKPSGSIEHKGGLRLPSESDDYKMLEKWIATGAIGPKANDPVLDHLEILPSAVRLERGNTQSISVRAHYSNGRIEDVTRWAKFNSTDEAVATVDEQGLAKVIGPGEGAVNAWFASRIVTARLSVPFSSQDGGSDSAIVRANFIDEHVSKQLVTLGLDFSSRSTDSEFIRRSALDVTGTLPTEKQVEEFLQDNSPDKRARWIDSLLESPEYVDYWTYRWSDLLMLNSNLLRADGLKSYYQWIRGHVQKNTAWDQFTREILTARGEAIENGATNFYAINQDPESMTENACQAFLGLSIGCAKCHNHPLEKWTNDQYYAMANLFARVRAKGWGGETRDGDSARTLMVLDRGDLIQPLRGKPQPPAPLDAKPLAMDSTEDRRVYLAQWMTSSDNPYFTRAIVNRVWAAYFGIGMVNAVDDLRASNPASNPALMNALCQHTVDHKFDLKELMRVILNSETYQRSSNTTELNKEDKKYFSHYYPRRLMAEVIHDAMVSVSTVPTTFNKVSFLGGDKRDTKFYGKGTRAIQLFDSSVDNNFLKTFGRNQRRITCECERSDEPSVTQVLNLNNGDTLNAKLAEKGSVVDQLLESHQEDYTAMVRIAYLRCLSRYPSEQESVALVKELTESTADERRTVVEDLLWSLMTSREFLFNH